jgi:hypothetical protein
LIQEYRVIDGMERVDIVNTMDRENVREKEAVHFAFPVNPMDGTLRLDGGWGIVRPTADQLPGSCVEYLSAGRWMDIANQEHGLTWTTVETPLVQVGAMVNEFPDDHGLRQWRKEIIPGSTFYSSCNEQLLAHELRRPSPALHRSAMPLPARHVRATDAFRRASSRS